MRQWHAAGLWLTSIFMPGLYQIQRVVTGLMTESRLVLCEGQNGMRDRQVDPGTRQRFSRVTFPRQDSTEIDHADDPIVANSVHS